MGPEISVALAAALQHDDESRMSEIVADINAMPHLEGAVADFGDFPKYNAQLERARIRAAGYVECGATRAPYLDEDLPVEWLPSLRANAQAWSDARALYAT
jgi:hypothetical protein